MESIYLPFVILFFLVLLSGASSAAETALFSLSKLQLSRFKSSDSILLKRVLELIKKPKHLIISLVLFNELVNSAIAIMMAALMNQVSSDWTTLSKLLLSTLISTFCIVLLGDVIPKSLGIRFAESYSAIAAYPLKIIMKVLTPIRLPVTLFVNRVITWLGGDPSQVVESVREEEFRRLVDESLESGNIDQVEASLIHNVFDFNDAFASELSKPVDHLFMLDLDQDPAELVRAMLSSNYTRVPVYLKSRHNLQGILNLKAALKIKRALAQGLEVKVESYLHKPYFILPNWHLDKVLRLMRQNRTHMVFTVDEYGALLGMITMDDLLQRMFGNLDEGDLN